MLIEPMRQISLPTQDPVLSGPLGEIAGSGTALGTTAVGGAESASGGPGAAGFENVLRSALQDVEQTDANAVEMKRRLFSGEPVELHQVLLATEKAQLSFQTLLSVRNRVLEAYQTLTQMPL